MNETTTGLLLAVLFFETISQLALKLASRRVGGDVGVGVRYLMAFVAQPAFWVALFAFVWLFLSWLAFLSRVPLGQGVMAGSITMVGVLLGGRLFFGEQITRYRALAIILIALGVTLVGWGRA